MFRRVLVAAVLSAGMAVSGTAMAAQAASAGPAVSGVTGAAAPATTVATPTFVCVPGIVSTICSLLEPIICRTSCEAAPSASTARTSAAVAPRVTVAAPSMRVATPAASAAPRSAAALAPFNDLCTIMIRPINPFCLLP